MLSVERPTSSPYSERLSREANLDHGPVTNLRCKVYRDGRSTLCGPSPQKTIRGGRLPTPLVLWLHALVKVPRRRQDADIARGADFLRRVVGGSRPGVI